MPHQDKEDLRTPLAELKDLLAPIQKLSVKQIPRHGNAELNLTSVAMMALLAFGWSQKSTLGERFEFAHDATKRGLPSVKHARSYQSLMVALRACGNSLLQAISNHLIKCLKRGSKWRLLGRPTFAIDGSQFAVPRTKTNLAAFAAAGRKSKAAYKNKADYAKAKTTQIAVTLCLHLTTGFPLLWNLGGSSDSERGLLLGMLDRLPSRSRLVMDAYYYGFDFWNQLIGKGFTFVVRAGKNIDLHGTLGLEGKVKHRGDLVFYWPQTAIDAGSAPIVLRLVTVMVGRKRMFLLTNELDLTDNQLAELYAKRWGIEVFFRTVKQSYERAKLLSRTPRNAKQEFQWTLLGIWMALDQGQKQIPQGRSVSPVQVLRVVCNLVVDVARLSTIKLSVAAQLATCFIADESGRKSEKNSKDYPRKKRKKQTGEPTVVPITKELRQHALELLN